MLGAVVGAMATGVMSIVMLGAKHLRIMPSSPPEEITEDALRATDTPASEEEIDVAASAAHVAFGAAGGAVFGLAAARIRPPVPELLSLPWALVIWAGSYFGWVPALRILPPPTEDRPGRAWTMLVAHLVFGAAMGAIWRVLAGRRRFTAWR